MYMMSSHIDVNMHQNTEEHFLQKFETTRSQILIIYTCEFLNFRYC